MSIYLNKVLDDIKTLVKVYNNRRCELVTTPVKSLIFKSVILPPVDFSEYVALLSAGV